MFYSQVLKARAGRAAFETRYSGRFVAFVTALVLVLVLVLVLGREVVSAYVFFEKGGRGGRTGFAMVVM
jgi:hypothetical protein